MKTFLHFFSIVLAAAATLAAAADAPIPGEALCDALPKLYDCHHLFSARIGEGDAVCFEGWLPDAPPRRYCAVFTNGALSRIVATPARWKTPGTDEAGNALHPGDDPALYPEDFVRSVLASTNFVPAETVVKQISGADKTPHVDWGLTAAFLAVRIACAPFSAEPAPEDDAPSDKSIMQTMDPLLVRLGMDRTTLEERIGSPRFSRQTKTRETIHYYGRRPKSVYNEGRCWLGIRYDSNAVSRVYTHRLLDRHAESSELSSHAESAESDSHAESAEFAEDVAFLAIGIAKGNVGKRLASGRPRRKDGLGRSRRTICFSPAFRRILRTCGCRSSKRPTHNGKTSREAPRRASSPMRPGRRPAPWKASTRTKSRRIDTDSMICGETWRNGAPAKQTAGRPSGAEAGWSCRSTASWRPVRTFPRT